MVSKDSLTRRAFVRNVAVSTGAGLLGMAPGYAQPAVEPLEQIIEKAKKEGAVTYYSVSEPGTNQRVAEVFKAKYGIAVETLKLGSSPLAQRYAAEVQGGGAVADVVVIALPSFFRNAAQNGWLKPLSGLPALEGWTPQFWDGQAALLGINPVTFAWNTKLVSADVAPKTWEDLLDPRWKGKMLFCDPRTVPTNLGWAALMRDTYGIQYLERLRAQNIKLVPGAIAGAQQLAAGEVQILVPCAGQVIVPFKEKGAPVADIIPNPTVGFELLGGVSAKSPHPYAGLLLFNFLLSKEGQSILNQGGGVSVLPNVENAGALPGGYVSLNAAKMDQITAKSSELLKALGI